MMKMKMFWVVALCFTLMMLGQQLAGAGDEITVKGAVYGSAWDTNGKVLAVSILTTEADELFVEHTALGEELLKLVEQNIKVTGAVNVQGEKKLFTVTKYEIAFN